MWRLCLSDLVPCGGYRGFGMTLLKAQLVKAGAGTGKTKSLVEEVYKTFKDFSEVKGRKPKLMVCTFTKKATQELRERLFETAKVDLGRGGTEFLNYIQSSSLYISTIDGILNKLLRQYGYKLNLSPDFNISYGKSNETLFDSLAEECVYGKYFFLLRKIPYPYLRELFLFYFNCCLKYGKVSFYDEKDFKNFEEQKQLFVAGKNSDTTDLTKNIDFFKQNNSPLAQLKDVEAIKELFKEEKSFEKEEFTSLFNEFHQAGNELFSKFMEKKKQKALLNIEDLLLFSLILLRQNPKTAQSFSREWDYWLVDEYQDTSWIQEQIIEQITKFKNVFCVGDPGQSIYSFRGADPQVFKRRENVLGKQTQELNTNYRSSSELIYFYNDFFPKEKDFIKFNPPKGQKINLDKPSVHFLTYEPVGECYKQQVFKALYHYIKKLKTEGFGYNEIAILSSKTKYLAETASYLRSQGLPLMLYSSKNFVAKRKILDALFLLKFLINPYDDINVKALLRTPYFRLSDQELADSSCEHFKLSQNKNSLSFWSFVKEKFCSSLVIKSLSSYLLLKKEQGLVLSFERALLDSGFMDASYFQDPTGSSESNLWKFLSLLHKNNSFALELFYSLMEEGDGEEEAEAPACENSQSIELMTIHKSKGLEFENVVILDFSIQNSILQLGDKAKDSMIFDEKRKKASFAVPIGGRNKKKVKSFGHKFHLKAQDQEKLLERDRLLYVAMTRARQSLAFFIPNSPPKKNSWLSRISFFDKFPGLIEKNCDEKNKLLSWKLKEGDYKTNKYSFGVKSSEGICRSSEEFMASKIFLCKRSRLKKESDVLVPDFIKRQKSSKNISEEDGPLEKNVPSLYKGQPVITAKDLHFSPVSEIQFKSSKDFVEYGRAGEQKKIAEVGAGQKTKTVFSLTQAKNTLFKAHLGMQLHLFLQQLSFFSFKEIQTLIANSLLSEENKKQVEGALLYILELKNPDMRLFLKTGFPEWSFKFKRRNVILQGQIDLWIKDQDGIHLFDYKSSFGPQVKKQLIFYSWVLNEFYKPENIFMYEVYPFQKTIKKSLYSLEDEQLLKTWLKLR